MNILILTTPFHLFMINKCRFLINGDLTYIFYSKYVERTEIEEKFKDYKVIFFQIPDFDNSQLPKSVFSFKRRLELRKHYYNLLEFIKSIDFISKINTVIIFSEKYLFTQIMLEKFRDSNIIAIDEGTGFYNKDSLKDKIKKILYLVFSPILFSGFSFRYFAVLGTHPLINEVYIRRPELISTVSNKIKYHKIQKDASNKQVSNTTEKSILLLTSPIYEDEKLPQSEAFDLLNKTMSILTLKGYKIYLKLHPRENIDKYLNLIQTYNLQTIPKQIRSEDLNYFDYKYIVHFFSSSIIDILDKDYPADRIISIYPSKSYFNRKHIFRNTQIIYQMDELNNLVG
jgi:hypothetical protein